MYMYMYNIFEDCFTLKIIFQHFNIVEVYQILSSSETKAECHSIENHLHLPHEHKLKFEQCENL